jgi:hypothetical protein
MKSDMSFASVRSCLRSFVLCLRGLPLADFPYPRGVIWLGHINVSPHTIRVLPCKWTHRVIAKALIDSGMALPSFRNPEASPLLVSRLCNFEQTARTARL